MTQSSTPSSGNKGSGTVRGLYDVFDHSQQQTPQVHKQKQEEDPKQEPNRERQQTPASSASNGRFSDTIKSTTHQSDALKSDALRFVPSVRKRQNIVQKSSFAPPRPVSSNNNGANGAADPTDPATVAAGHSASPTGIAQDVVQTVQTVQTGPAIDSVKESMPKPTNKTRLEDWLSAASSEDINGFYATQAGHRQLRRDQRKAKRKGRSQDSAGLDAAPPDWNEPYDPLRPNDYDMYMQSEEFVDDQVDWELYLKSLKRDMANAAGSGHEDNDTGDNNGSRANSAHDIAPEAATAGAPTVATGAAATDAATDNDTLQMHSHLQYSQQFTQHSPLQPELVQSYAQESHTIEAAPIRYSMDQTKSKYTPNERDNFAERMMKKLGWEKGRGLGLPGREGIVAPLRVTVSKDARGTGKIVDRNPKRNESTFGKMSSCIVLTNIAEDGAVDDSIAQEIGNECNQKVCLYSLCRVYDPF